MQALNERHQIFLMNHRLSARDADIGAFESRDTPADLINAHLGAAAVGLGGIAPFAVEVAAGKSDECRRRSL